ncbi:hypothetical protein N306_00034, partial [Opisthocomus hoazin]
RAAASMWRVMLSASRTGGQVVLKLLCVLEDWPLHSTFTSDGDKSDVSALAATRVLQDILKMPCCPESLKVHFHQLFLALLFQVFLSTEQMPEESDTCWRECQEEDRLP